MYYRLRLDILDNSRLPTWFGYLIEHVQKGDIRLFGHWNYYLHGR